MNLTATRLNKLLKRKIATTVLVTASVCAFATLGDDGGKKGLKTPNSDKFNSKTISLRPTYNYKSNNFFNTPAPSRYIMLNTVVTYQKGNTTYIMPLKKKVLLDKIKFNPSH